MKITVDDRVYYVDFEYTPAGTTICQIKDQPKDLGYLGYGIAWKHPLDRFDKEKGRKISLRRALIGFCKRCYSQNSETEQRDFRRKFWNQVHVVRNKTQYLKHAGQAVA